MGHSDHSSRPAIARGLKRPYPRAMGGRPNPPIWSCSRWGLPCVRHRWRTGELLPRHFNLTGRPGGRRCVFCGTFPRSLGAVVSGHRVLGVRTFLASCRSPKRDRLIHFSPKDFLTLAGGTIRQRPSCCKRRCRGAKQLNQAAPTSSADLIETLEKLTYKPADVIPRPV